MPELELNEVEALLLALVRQEEGRLRLQIERLEQDIRANRMAAMINIFKTRGEELKINPLDIDVLTDENGRPVKVYWKKE